MEGAGLLTGVSVNSIFDELKEVRRLTRNSRFQESFDVKYIKEIKRFQVFK